MAEIKSFREYIKEQEEILEESELSIEDEFNIGELATVQVTDIYPRNLSGDIDNQKKQVNTLYSQVAATLKNLENGNYVTTKLDVVSNKEKQDSTQQQNPEDAATTEKPKRRDLLPLNITNGETIYSIVRDWSIKWFSKIKSARETKSYMRDINIMRKGSSSEKDEAYKRISANEDIDENSENLLNEFTWRTAGEISSGIGNRFNTTRLFNKASRYKTSGNKNNPYDTRNYQDYNEKNNKAKGVYNVDPKLIDKVRIKYRNDAFKLIKSEISYAKNYLAAAQKKLNRYNAVATYIKTNDRAYLDDIFSILLRALASATDIGTNLKKLNTECKNALNRVYNEMVYQDEGLKEKKGLKDTQATIDAYKAKLAKKKEKEEFVDAEKAAAEQKKQEDEAISKAKEEESKKAIERDEIIDKKTLDDFANFLKNNRRSSLTLETLTRKLRQDTVQRLSDDEKFSNLQTTYLLLKLLTGELENFGFGSKSNADASYKRQELSNMLKKLHSSEVNGEAEENGLDWEEIKAVIEKEIKKLSADKDLESKNKELKKTDDLAKKIKAKTNQELSKKLSSGYLKFDDIINIFKRKLPGSYSEEEYLPEVMAAYVLWKLMLTGSGRDAIISADKKNPLSSEKLDKFYKEGIAEKEEKNWDLKKFKESILRKIRISAEPSEKVIKLSSTPTAAASTPAAETKLAAKDFDEEKESQPKNIYAYAVQKAKKLQER